MGRFQSILKSIMTSNARGRSASSFRFAASRIDRHLNSSVEGLVDPLDSMRAKEIDDAMRCDDNRTRERTLNERTEPERKANPWLTFLA